MTDAIAAMGMPDGEYILGGIKVKVAEQAALVPSSAPAQHRPRAALPTSHGAEVACTSRTLARRRHHHATPAHGEPPAPELT